MKRFSLVFILICIIVSSASCTMAPDLPSDGIWYNEELKLAIEFENGNASVSSYDQNLSNMDLQLRDWIDGGFDIVYTNAEKEAVEIYSGWRKRTEEDRFIILLYSKANPDDDFKTQIELDDEEYVFVRVDSLSGYNCFEKT